MSHYLKRYCFLWSIPYAKTIIKYNCLLFMLTENLSRSKCQVVESGIFSSIIRLTILAVFARWLTADMNNNGHIDNRIISTKRGVRGFGGCLEKVLVLMALFRTHLEPFKITVYSVSQDINLNKTTKRQRLCRWHYHNNKNTRTCHNVS